MIARRAAAVTAARVSGVASRLLGRGGGTALPGLVATALDRDIVRELAGQLSAGSLVVSGTNGKTTTCLLLAGIARQAGYRPLRNHSGSNLVRGLASTLVQQADLMGRLSAAERTIGVFEVDEAALPELVRSIRPSRLVLLNLFRDQLDRYGEVATVAEKWRTALDSVGQDMVVIANADDPLVTSVVFDYQGERHYFGVSSGARASTRADHASDVKACPRCGGSILYEQVFLGHLGHYRCTECGFERPRPEVTAEGVQLSGLSGSSFVLGLPVGSVEVSFPLPGMYNVYNALGAAAAAASRDIGAETIRDGLEAATAAFGRMERVEIAGRTVELALAKNPAGLNEVLRTVVETGSGAHLLVMLNDNTADGRDVSWIWDADVEVLSGSVCTVVFSGRRAEDMALRFKYSGVVATSDGAEWAVERDVAAALDRAVEMTPPSGTLFVIPTYTAMLAVRGVLTHRDYVQPYWED
jgi:UDP-N-acetylmuramyl tripeptide synthase